MKLLTAFLLSLLVLAAHGQNKYATVTGHIIDENENGIANVSIIVLGKSNGISATDSGIFTLKVPAEKSFALVFTHTGYNPVQKNFYLSPGETEQVTIRMLKNGKTLQTVIIKDDKEHNETGLVKINPKNAITMPSTTGGVEALIKTLVGSNNELTSQYNVRGGSYDENLVYINDFEIYRPYLVSSGQQEGLSLINPELTRNVNFYTGGYQAKYGDKMSSVLDIQYKKPTTFAGSAYISLLEQGFSIEGAAKNGAITYLAGVRNKSNNNVLSSQPTVGSYIPSASDAQAYITYKMSERWQLELLGIVSTSRFHFYPESVKKTASVFSPLFTANLGLDVFFTGQEKDSYGSSLIGATLINNASKKLKLKWMLSHFTDKEKENYDIGGAYLFGERDFDNNSATFGQIINSLGSGYYQNYARNQLNITVWNVSHKGSFDKGNHFIQWGAGIEQNNINDKLAQFEYRDSAGYSLPYTPGPLTLYNAQNSAANLSIEKYSGYLQDNIHIIKTKNDMSLQAGVRFNYNSFTKEFLVSPRAQLSYKPNWEKDIVFKAAAGIYDQPPFYREYRMPNGVINTNIKSQKSAQFVAGMDYNFKGPDELPFRFTTEAYYKSMWDVVPYDIDNVKIQYLGSNNAKAYATGIEFRLFGELVKDAQSWLSIGLMRTRENINNDYYYDYKNAEGEIINANTSDKIVTDSVKNEVGWLRRPTDRLITAGLFLEDYLPTNKNFKVHLNLLYGSNMSYNIPGSVRYRNGLIIDPYMRVDIGFSALLLSEKSARRSHSPFKSFENIWASLEVFNLINRDNTISYQLIKDFSNTTYAIPNRLTPRLLNVKIVGRF
ncbi:MAG: carboxypeptidase-like regulatory domain-containing protein [Bacteroidetes bacterium]|nr:carboxypeptidase-like regulatory domain-containing protein [Bacteroidota bacterium]